MSNVFYQEKFQDRHNGPRAGEVQEMLSYLRVQSLDQLIEQAVPSQIRLKKSLSLPAALSEQAYLAKIQRIADKNKVFKSYIGQGYYDVTVPAVIQRNVLENPGWYTQY